MSVDLQKVNEMNLKRDISDTISYVAGLFKSAVEM
jgi:hypothetical protein